MGCDMRREAPLDAPGTQDLQSTDGILVRHALVVVRWGVEERMPVDRGRGEGGGDGERGGSGGVGRLDVLHIFKNFKRSDHQVEARLDRELLLLDAHIRPVRGVVDHRQVSLSGALAHAAELIIHGAVAQTHPAFVRAEIRHRDAAEMRADRAAHHHLRVAR